MVRLLLILAFILAPAGEAWAEFWTQAAVDCAACRTLEDLRRAVRCAPEYEAECLRPLIDEGVCVYVRKGTQATLVDFHQVDGPALVKVAELPGQFYAEPNIIPQDIRDEWHRAWLNETKRLKGHAD